MNRFISAILLSFFVVFLGCSYPEPSKDPVFEWFVYKGNDPIYNELEVADNEYVNPILAGFYPDPSIVRVEEDYYMVNSSFGFYPGIPIFHSKDLVSWTQLGHVLDRPSQLHLDSLGTSQGVFAPTIEHSDGVFYVINTLVNGGGNFFVTATNPAGPWSDPVWLPKVGGIDPSFFFDDDGKVYIIHNDEPEGRPLYSGHRAIRLHEYDPETQTTGVNQIVINGGTDVSKKPVWIEAPHLIKVNGEYILHAAEGGTGPEHSQVVFKSENVWGPYVSYEKNPILTQRALDQDRPNPIAFTGHADLVETQNGDWWAVFLGVRPYEGNYFNTGRETFLLPVTWKDGWPIILEENKSVPLKGIKPNLPKQRMPETPTNGNFTIRDNFDNEALADYWAFIRTPREKWYDLSNGLKIKARTDHINGLGNPSFIGRRFQHMYGSASTKMIYDPEEIGNEAGLIVFQNKAYYYFLGLMKNLEGETIVQVEYSAGPKSRVITRKSLPINKKGEVYLKIEVRGDKYDFYYALKEGNWTKLYWDGDAKILSTESAGGFVGSFIGMYAYSETEE